MPTRTLNVVIAGDSKQLGVASKQADQHMQGTEKSAKRMGTAVKAGFGVAAAGAGLLVVGLKKSVDAAIEAEKSQARMTAQLKASGISYRAHAQEIDKVIQKHSRLAGVDDEDLQDAFTNIVRATGKVSVAMKDMGLVTDLMRARNMSAAKAGDLLAKVHNGNVGALKRLGVAIDPVTKATDSLRESNKKATAEQIRAAKKADETATAQRALAALQKRFGGQAEAYGKTAAGAQDRFAVAVENLQEKIGGKLLPVLTKATQGVAKFAGEMDEGTGSGGKFAKQISGLTRSLGPYADATGDVIKQTKKHETVMTALGEVMPNPMKAMRNFTAILNGVKKAAEGVVTAVKAVGSALNWTGNAAKDAGGFLKDVAGSLNPIGDGLGKMGSGMPSGTFGGGLMGARPSMAPFASAASRFGLRVSSGKRPGSITSSGNVSYHSSGEAIDVAGSPAGMLAFFRQAKAKWGGRLAELIHTPGGAGVKNGKSYSYGGQVAADHFDHVHLAYDTGAPGVGDGIGQIKSLWTQAGGSSSAQNIAAAVAMAESGGDPTITNRNTDGSIDRGLWQINSVHGSLSTLDRLGNARAAVSISSNGRNWKPWVAYTNGSYRKFLGAASGTSGSSADGGSKRTKTYKKNQTASGGGLGGYDPSVVYATENDAAENLMPALGRPDGVQGFLAPKALSRALKGGGPSKGISTAEGAARQTVLDAAPPPPTAADFLDANVARARLTDTTDDDIAALSALRDLRKTQMDAALADSDPRNDAEAIDAFLQVKDALKSLTDSIDQANDIQRQRDELNATIATNQEKILALANQGPQIVAAVVAAVSGGIGGQIGLGMQTPGFAGGVARYGVGGL